MTASRAGIILVLALTACTQEPQRDIATNQDAANQPASPLHDVTEPTVPASNAAAPEASAGSISAALHGRWGLVPGDCTSTRGDAKGLVTIGTDEIRFYESVARPAKIAERTGSKIRGEFDFTGEGMEWTNSMIWSANGNKLTRVDSEDDSRLVYTRC